MGRKRIDLEGQQFGRLTVLRHEPVPVPGGMWLCRCSCGTETLVRGGNLRTGRQLSCGCLRSEVMKARAGQPLKEFPGYTASHIRVYKAKGRAADHLCAHCGDPAEQWAYTHSDPHELTSPEGFPYSPDPEHYMPLCRSCHKRYDLAD